MYEPVTKENLLILPQVKELFILELVTRFTFSYLSLNKQPALNITTGKWAAYH